MSGCVDMACASPEPSLQRQDFTRRLAAEGLGTALLLVIVIGSGIMGERLAGGNTAIALLGNTLATGAGLVVLITILGPLSGAHLNPAVTLVLIGRRELGPTFAYVVVQIAAALAGVWIAHLMFGEAALQVSTKVRSGSAQALSEGIATFGLITCILGALRFRPQAVPWVVGLYIISAYWFTASRSFANPAATIARCFSETFAGIAPASAPAFIIAQFAGAAAAAWLGDWLFREARSA